MMNKNSNGFKKVTKILASTIIFIGVAIVFNACASSEIADSEDVNQAKIHQQYSVYYDANDGDSYRVESQFRFGGNKGTTLRLSNPSTVSVNDKEMDEETQVLRGCYYEMSITGTNSFTFSFIDTEEKEYINECKITSAELKAINKINADKSLKVKWIGKPLDSKETMTLTIEDNDNNTTIISTDIIGSTYITVNPKDMETLVKGKGQIFLSRSYSSSLQEAAEDGGNIYTQYISKKISINILKKSKPTNNE